MKRRIKTIILIAVLIMSISIPAFASYNEYPCWCSGVYGAHVCGLSSSFGGTNTYGYSWLKADSQANDYIWTTITVGGNRSTSKGEYYVQTEQISYKGNVSVIEQHGARINDDVLSEYKLED